MCSKFSLKSTWQQAGDQNKECKITESGREEILTLFFLNSVAHPQKKKTRKTTSALESDKIITIEVTTSTRQESRTNAIASNKTNSPEVLKRRQWQFNKQTMSCYLLIDISNVEHNTVFPSKFHGVGDRESPRCFADSHCHCSSWPAAG